MKLHLVLEENPSGTAQEKGTSVQRGRVHHYTKPAVARQRAIYKAAVVSEMAKKGKLTRLHLQGPVRLEVSFHFQTKTKKLASEPKITKPDCDNMVKLLQDVLDELGFFEVGDQQVTTLIVKKFWTLDKPFIDLEVTNESV